MATSMKTAFIRVSSINETKENGTVKYTIDDISSTLADWCGSCKLKYWFAEHTADEEISQTHWHIVIQFKNPMPFDNVKKHFPYGDIETCKHGIRACVRYLVHADDKSKHQYSWDIIQTNDSVTRFKLNSKYDDEITIESVMEKIEKGEIREYNQFELIPITLWAKYRSRIENALIYHREKIYMDKNREIQVVFISGATGCGKTTFAKQYCENAGKSYCVSSSSNDPLQDYKGEDVLILDDLRDDVFSFTDLLKILDNHTKTTVKSRYHNKAFIGEMIVITSYRPLCDWYFNVDREAKKQLYRRISTQFQFTEDEIRTFTFDEKQEKYVYVGKTPNYIKMSAKKKTETAVNMLKALGLELSEELETEVSKRLEEEFQSVEESPFD